MARIQLNIRFYFQDILYIQKQGFIPRHQAIKIPQLRVQQIQTRSVATKKSFPAQKQSSKNRNNNGKNNYDKDQEVDVDQEQNQDNQMIDNQIDMEQVQGQAQEEAEGQGEAEGEQDNQMGDADIDQDEQPDISDQVEQAEEAEQDQLNQQMNEEELEEEIDSSNEDNDLSELSRSLSPNMNYGKYKTKRQKGQLDNFLQLPLKKQRKDAKKYDQATEILRKQQKQKKRKQYIKKLMQAQEKATFDKILNETGRKFRQREQKQQKQVKQRCGGKSYRTLGDVPKIITKQTSKGTQISTHRTGLFSANMMEEPNVKMSQECTVCHSNVGKYRTGSGRRFCSVTCFKLIQKEKQNGKMIG